MFPTLLDVIPENLEHVIGLKVFCKSIEVEGAVGEFEVGGDCGDVEALGFEGIVPFNSRANGIYKGIPLGFAYARLGIVETPFAY